MLRELAARRTGGQLVALQDDGSMRPVDDATGDLKLVREYLGAAAAPQEKAS